MSDSSVSALIWNSLPLPAIVIDSKGIISDLNVVAETFLRLSRRALIGQSAARRIMVVPPLEEVLPRLNTTQAALFINEAEITLIDAFGPRTTQPCTLHLAPLIGGHGNGAEHPFSGGALLLIAPRDVSDRLGRAVEVHSAAHSSTKSAVGMADMLAHEIKNPLAGISGAAQLLSMNLDVQERELTDLIVAETRRIVTLLEQVEQFGAQRPPTCRAVNLHDALDRARRSAGMGHAAHLKIIEDYDPSLPATFADGDQLMQVFLNLITNAAQACAAGGTVRLRSYYDAARRVRRQNGQVESLPLTVEVIDDGPGIAADLLPAIFDPFVSGRESGKGLGLALVLQIIKAHHGWIEVESAPGRTLFRVSMPLAPRAHEPGAAAPASKRAMRTGSHPVQEGAA